MKHKLISMVIMAVLAVSVWGTIPAGKVKAADEPGDFRSATSGNWDATSTWERYDGAYWTSGVGTPTNADGVITIRNGHTVTVSADVSVDQVVVDAGGQVTVNNGSVFNVAGGAGTDLSVFGAFLNQGTLSVASGATWAVNDGGTYIHNTTSAIATPLDRATLSVESTFIYRGNSIARPTMSMSGRTYGNLTFESTSGNWSTNALVGTTATIINGDFAIGANVTFNNNTLVGLAVAGNWINDGTFTPGTGTVTFNGTYTQTIDGNVPTTFYNLTLAAGSSVALASDFTVDNTFTINAGASLGDDIGGGFGHLITAKGDVVNYGQHFGLGKILLTGGSAPHAILGGGRYWDLELDDVQGAILSGAGTLVDGTLTVTSGLFNAASSGALEAAVVEILTDGSLSAPANASLIVIDGWYNNGAFTPGDGGTVVFVHTVAIGGSQVTSFNNIDIQGDVLLPSLDVDQADTMNVAGNWTGSGTVDPGTGLVVFNGNVSQTIDGAATTFYNLTIADGATARLAQNVSVASGGTATIEGTLNTGTNAVTGAGVFTLASGGTLGVGSPAGIATGTSSGNIRVTGTRTYDAGASFVFNGSGNQVIGDDFPTTLNNLTINAGSSVDVGTGALTVSGSVTNNGTLRQTRDVAANSTVGFLNISTNKYYGVEITSGGIALGSTAVAVSGNQASCPNALGFPVRRCFEIAPASQQSANIKFYYTQAEMQVGQTFGNLNVWHYNDILHDWDGPFALGGNGGDCTSGRIDCYVQANDITSFSPFVLKVNAPTAVNLASFTATRSDDHNLIAWETASELHNLGFNLWRGTSASTPAMKLNEFVIPSQAPGGTDGFAYSYDDFDITSGVTYYYWLEDVDLNGTVTRHGPVSTSGDSPTAIMVKDFAASPVATSPLIAIGVIDAIVLAGALRLLYVSLRMPPLRRRK